MNEHGAIVFNGDGYSEEWHQEAEKRGLLNRKTTVEALPAITEPATVAMFAKYSVLSERELKSREETYFEQYCQDRLGRGQAHHPYRQDDDLPGGGSLSE